MGQKPIAAASQDGLVESCRCRCRCARSPHLDPWPWNPTPPPLTPIPRWHDLVTWWAVRWHGITWWGGRSAFTLSQHVLVLDFSLISLISGNQIAGVDINNPQPTLEAAAAQQQKPIIWTGALEWTDKSKPPQPGMAAQQKTTRSLACHLNVAQNDPDV